MTEVEQAYALRIATLAVLISHLGGVVGRLATTEEDKIIAYKSTELAREMAGITFKEESK